MSDLACDLTHPCLLQMMIEVQTLRDEVEGKATELENMQELLEAMKAKVGREAMGWQSCFSKMLCVHCV